jgi:hypothetical protein
MLLFHKLFFKNFDKWHIICINLVEREFQPHKGSLIMRTLVSLGLLVLSLGISVTAVFADGIADCEPLKQSGEKNLYGLCVAWHSADEEAKDALAAKFFDRAGYPVPGSSGPDPEPDFNCPCWDTLSYEYICALGEPTLQLHFPGISVVWFAGVIESTTELFSGSTDTSGCAHTITYPSGAQLLEVLMGGLTADEALDCQAEAAVMADLYLDPICTGE